MRLAVVPKARPFVAGCALGLATIGAATSGTHAGASRAAPALCRSIHANVEGYDARLPGSYGNQGYIYVNRRSALSHLHNYLARSLFVIGPGVSNGKFLNDVEIGWTSGPGRFRTPEVYSEWVNRGVDSRFRRYAGYMLRNSANYHFTVENAGRKFVWRYLIDGRSRPFDHSPKMDFNHGYVLTNSERYNTCDSLFASFRGLRYSSAPGKWRRHYLDLGCYLDNSRGWYFHKISNSGSTVTQKRSSCWVVTAAAGLAVRGETGTGPSQARAGGAGPAGEAGGAGARASQADPLVQGQRISVAAASSAVGFRVMTPRPGPAVSGLQVTAAWVNRQSRQVALVLGQGKVTVMMWPVAAAGENAVSYFRDFIAQNNAKAFIGRIDGAPALVIRPHTDASRSNPAWVELYRGGVDINIYSASYTPAGLVQLAGTMR